MARLRYIVDQEGVAISDEALAMVARKGDGSMRDALSTLDQVLAFCGDDGGRCRCGGASRGGGPRASSWRRAARSSTATLRGVLEIVAQVDSFGYSMRQFCQELIDQFRSIAILKAVGDAGDLLELSEAELDELDGAGRRRPRRRSCSAT